MRIPARVLLFFTLAAISCFAEKRPEEEKAKLLKSITITPAGTIAWDVDTVSIVEGKISKIFRSDTYLIDLKSATMTMKTDGIKPRFFNPSEASAVMEILKLLTNYAAGSTVWWDNGEGSPTPVKPKPEKKKPAKELMAEPIKLAKAGRL